MAPIKPTDGMVEAEVQRLSIAPIAELRLRWRSAFNADPPKAFGPDLLRRSLARKIQEDAYGALPAAPTKLLNQLIAQNAKSNGKIVLPRRIKVGAVLVREWKGKSHRIVVRDEGFTFEDKSYSSLSEIARLITGARWNGPRFFGLRDKDAQP